MSSVILTGTYSGGTALSNAVRNANHATINYHEDIFVAAQATMSKVRPASVAKSIRGDEDTFPVIQEVNYKARKEGFLATQYSAFNSERRVMRARQWELAFASTDTDNLRTDIDVLEAAKSQLMPAQARVIDTVLLGAQIEPLVRTEAKQVIDSTASGATDESKRLEIGGIADRGGYNAFPTREIKSRRNVYVNLDTNKLKAFSVNDLVDIRRIFRERDVDEGGICGSLTPKMEAVLMKDSDFKDSQRVHKIGGDIDSLNRSY